MKRTLIIAEAGVNHNGSMETAKQLIDIAAAAGVDFVKFQTFKADRLVSLDAPKADYQLKNTGDADASQFSMLKKLELTEADHKVLVEYCNSKKINFLSTAFDEESLDFLFKLGIRLFKIPSGEITNLPYLRKIGSYQQNVILSTGMSDLTEIKEALNVLITSGTKKENISVLHCNTEYPTPMHDVNLAVLATIKKELGVKVGYSDHTLGIEVPIAAVAMGAEIIEKHFTVDRNMEGPDHKASLEPDELSSMVKAIRNIEIAIGNPVKIATESEKKNKTIARKSIHYSSDLSSGHILQESDLVMKRPGDGISPMLLPNVVGRKITRNITHGSKLTMDDFK